MNLFTTHNGESAWLTNDPEEIQELMRHRANPKFFYTTIKNNNFDGVIAIMSPVVKDCWGDEKTCIDVAMRTLNEAADTLGL